MPEVNGIFYDLSSIETIISRNKIALSHIKMCIEKLGAAPADQGSQEFEDWQSESIRLGLKKMDLEKWLSNAK